MKKTAKYLAWLVALVMALGMFAACGDGGGEEPPAEAPATDETPTDEPAAEAEETAADPAGGSYTVGVALMNLQVEFSIVLRDAIQAKADEMGVEVLINDAQGDASKQLEQIESFVAQGVDGIILQPQEQEASSPCIDLAQNAGIPIINVNSHTVSEPDAFVGSDDSESAEIALNYIKDQLGGEGNVVMMHGHPGQTAEIQRTEGAMAIIDATEGLELLDEQTANWDRAEAMTLMENWMQVHGDAIDAVFGQNDEMALGAANAVVQAGKKDDVLVVGVDAVDDALAAVKAGEMDATVFQDGVGQGAGAVETIVKLIEGQSVEASVLIPFILVTADNVDEYLA